MADISRRVFTVGCALGCTGLRASASAAVWPVRPITLIVPFPAGGSSDVVARIYAEALKGVLGQPIVVENRAGANGNIGAAQVARSTPDGYVLLLSGNGQNAMNHGLYTHIPYDSRKDFVHISQLASIPNALVVSADHSLASFAGFLTAAKNPAAEFPFASTGIGSSGHLAMVMLQQAAGLRLQHVPYRGAAPLITDLLGKHVTLGILNADNPLSHVRDGKLRVLAVTSAERTPLYPDAQTIAESGFPGFVANGWMGLSAPAGTPAAVVERIHDGLRRAVQTPSLRDRLTSLGYVPRVTDPTAYAAFVSAEIDKWDAVIKAAGVTIE